MEQQGIDKKAIIAILLCAVIWAVWMSTSSRRAQQAAKQAAAEKQLAATTGTAGEVAVTGTGGAVAAAPGDTGATPAPATPVAAVTPVKVTLANDVLEVTLSNAGARPVAADLTSPKYEDEEKGERGGDEAIAELVKPEVRGSEEFAALGPWFGSEASSRIPVDAPFAVVSSSGDAVTFRYRDATGLTLTRTYRISDEHYTLELIETYENAGAQPITGRPGAMWAANVKEAAEIKKAGDFVPGTAVNDRFHYKPPKPSDEKVYGGTVEFVGMHDRYFAGAVSPTDPRFDATESVRFLRPSKEAVVALALDKETTLSPGEKEVFEYEVYLGPKDYSILRDEGHHFWWMMNWGQGQGGWAPIGWITTGMWYALRWFESLVGNWGVAIILLTFVMRGALWPLAAKQMRTANEFAAKSQKIKPQIDKLREKYAADPMEMNKQTMQLYKQHGISPFSPLAGCLPLLLQLPIWWGLYGVLNTSIDLRGAPFYLWIQDLSQPDPYYITPVLLGVVTWLQMKLTPTAGADPTQQKMMQWMMPIMFTFFMWSLPAGLVVYIFTSTLMGIIQQFILKRGMRKDAPSVAAREATS